MRYNATTTTNPRPRTDPIEAKAKDQGHNVLTQVFSKKNIFLNLQRGLWCVLQDEEKKRS